MEQNIGKEMASSVNKTLCRNKEIEISAGFYIYLVYVLLIWLFDAADFICYFDTIPQATLMSRIVVCIGFALFLKKVKGLYSVKWERPSLIEAVCMIILVIFGLMKSIYPDTAYDTLSYHLILQQSEFAPIFSDNFASGGMGIGMFHLGDKVFYPFRILLGYRMGTILNTIVLLIIYRQLVGIIKDFFGDQAKESKKPFRLLMCPEIWAMPIVMGEQILFMCGIYYLDILPIPFALECLRRILISLERKPLTQEIYYFAGLAGIWFAFKMTQIVFIAPFVLAFIVISHTELNAKKVSVSALLCAIPCSISPIYAVRETGNPLFPFYNAFFKSPYFAEWNFKDGRWGPTSLKETLLWPIYRVFKPEYRQAEIPGSHTFLYAVGLLCLCWVIWEVFNYIKAKKSINKQRLVICILFATSALCWSVTTGYLRYFILGDIILGLMAYDFMANVVVGIDKSGIKKSAVICLASLVLVVVATQSALSVKNNLKGVEWSWRPFSVATAKTQLPHLFRDRKFLRKTLILIIS